jgi:hypothetical protein
MRSPLTPPSLIPLTHAGLTSSAYILIRETRFPQWLSMLDDCVWAVAALAIVIAWHYLFPHKSLAMRGALIGGVVAGSMAILSLGLLVLGLSLWAGAKPIGLPGMSLVAGLAFGSALIGWIVIVFSLLVAAVVGGLVAGVLYFRNAELFGRAALPVAIVVASLGAIVPVSAAVTRSTLGMGVIEFVTYKELRPFPVEIAVDLTVGRESVTIRRVFSCSRLASASDRKRVVHDRVRQPYWLPTLKSFGQTFADGSGVFVITPDACRQLSSRWGLVSAWLGLPLHSQTENVLAPDYIPLIGWTANAVTLDGFDLYIDGTAYTQPGSRIQVHKTTMRRMPLGTKLSDLDGFARIGWQDGTSGRDIPSKDAHYRAAFGIKIPSEQLMRYPAVTAILAAVAGPRFVLEAMSKRQGLDPRRSELEGIHGEPFPSPFIARNGTSIPAEPTEGLVPEKLSSLGGVVFPLRQHDNAWIASSEESGVLAFYRRVSMNSKDEDVPSPIMLGPYSVTRESGDRGIYLFDPTSMGLARLSVTYFALAQPDGPFASH